MPAKITFLSLASLLLLTACEEDNAKQCADLQNDANKRPLALAFCEKAALVGDANAQLFMAKEKWVRGEHQQAVELLEKSANQKNAEAAFQLGEIYAQEKELEKARFYYQHSCDLHFIKGCERISVLNDQTKEQQQKQKLKAETEAAQAKEKEAIEAKAKAEQQVKEAERQAKEAEQKALNAEKQRLAQERKQLEEKNRIVSIESLFMSKEDAINAYKDFISTLNQNGSLEEWVNNCYAKSSNKRGCFHLDQLVSIFDEQAVKEGATANLFFADSRVRNRALRNIPELQNATTAQFNRMVANAREILTLHMPTLSAMFEEPQEHSHSRTKPIVNTTVGNADTRGLDFQENLAKVEQNGLWGFVDRQGNMVIRPQFSGVGGFYYGRAAAQTGDGNWGYIDKRGNWIVRPQFCMAGRFSEGLAGVYVNGYVAGDTCVGGKWGFIDINGNFIIQPVFEEATRFNKGKAKVIYQGQSGYINRNSQWVN